MMINGSERYCDMLQTLELKLKRFASPTEHKYIATPWFRVVEKHFIDTEVESNIIL